MMNLDFGAFKVPDAVNKKKPGGLPSKVQGYDNLKYRKASIKKDGVVAKFYVSDKRFAELNLDTNEFLGVIHPTSKQVLLGVVGTEQGNLLRQREGKKKGHAFKSDTIEAALLATGVIKDAPIGTNQFVDMELVGTNVVLDGVTCSHVFMLKAGVQKPKEEITTSVEQKAKVEEPTKSQAEAPVTATTAAAAPVAAAEADWN